MRPPEGNPTGTPSPDLVSTKPGRIAQRERVHEMRSRMRVIRTSGSV